MDETIKERCTGCRPNVQTKAPAQPMANPLGLRPLNLQRVFSYACGNAHANSCAIGERLVGACSHCKVALALAGAYPGNQGLFCTTHQDVNLLNRKNNPNMDAATLTEMS